MPAKTKIVVLTEDEYSKPEPTQIFFKVDLPGKELMIEPATVVTIASIGLKLYEILSKSKDNSDDNIVEWLSTINYKLDSVLKELKDIREELIKIEIKIGEIPLINAESRMKDSINRYYLNIDDLKEDPANPVTKDIFTSIYSNLQDDLRSLFDNNSFYLLYEFVLAFTIQYEISCALKRSKGTKRAIIEKFLYFLQKAKDPEQEKSFGYILQVHRNTMRRLVEIYQELPNGQERQEYVSKREQTFNGPGEGWDRSEIITKIGYNFSIMGTVENGFTLTKNYIGEVDRRNSQGFSDISRDLEGTKNEIQARIQNKFNEFQNATRIYKETDKNVAVLKNILRDIDKYIALLENLVQSLTTPVPENG